MFFRFNWNRVVIGVKLWPKHFLEEILAFVCWGSGLGPEDIEQMVVLAALKADRRD